MSDFLGIIKDKLTLFLGNNQENNININYSKNDNTSAITGICTRCHKTTEINEHGLCENCSNTRKALLNAANPKFYNENTYIKINQNLDILLQYDFNKLDIKNAETVENLNGIEKAFLLYCDLKSIYDFNVARYWFYQHFIDCNYLISKLLKNGYLEIKYNSDLMKLTAGALKEILKRNNIKISGNKAELVKRIEENFTKEQINELAKSQRNIFVITEKGKKEIGEYRPIIAHDVDFENNCYSLIIENKLDEAYQMMCKHEQNKLVSRGVNCDWNNPPKKKFIINMDISFPFNLPNCLKPYEKEIKAITIYTDIKGANPTNSVPLFYQRVNANIDRQILEKAFIFLSAYECGASALDYSDIENLEQEQQRIDNTPKEFFETLSIDKFIYELKNRIIKYGLDIDKLEYDVLKDGTYNFTYSTCQIGRVMFCKRKSKMQILTKDTVKWLENLSMEEYINNIDKWIEYAKQLGKYCK